MDTLEQLDEVLAEDVQLVLLDNFPVWQTRTAVQRRDSPRAPHVLLESSGGLSLDTAADAGTGVDYLAVGAHPSVRVLDVGGYVSPTASAAGAASPPISSQIGGMMINAPRGRRTASPAGPRRRRDRRREQVGALPSSSPASGCTRSSRSSRCGRPTCPS